MKNKLRHILVVLLLVFSNYSRAQDFLFLNGKISETMSFQLINNLIILPIEVNGSKLSFILDSGVAAPVIFNLTSSDSLKLIHFEKIKIRGLGVGEPIEALHSKSNRFQIGSIYASNHELFIIHKEQFDLSAKLGIPVHGMIGHDLLKNFVVTINYISKRITFTKPEAYKYKKCAKCETFDLEFYKDKPYIMGEVIVDKYGRQKIPVKLLIDSGGTDALWLFEDDLIKVPENSFDDFLGEGVSGSIYGKRSKLKLLSLKSFVFQNPNVAFLDSLSTHHAKKFESRNGSLGSGILKRFKVIFDYPNSKITLKKNANFNDVFGYNMSGIELMHSGKELVKEQGKAQFLVSDDTDTQTTNTVFFDYSYKYNFKPIYKIAEIRKNSPAEMSGLKIGDVLIKINGHLAYNYSMQELNEKFYKKENKVMRLLVNRDGEQLEFEFKLKDLLK